jgi:hypothetical protein
MSPSAANIRIRTRLLAAIAPALLSTPAWAAAGDPAGAAGDVSGVLVPEAGEDQASPARALLLLPRLAVNTVAIPVRGGLRLYERHNVRERVVDLFFDDSRTFGIYPRLTLESRTTIGAGVRVVHRNMFGSGVRFKGAADAGGEYQQRLDASLSSPGLFGAPLWLHLRGGWQRQPRAPFYGIGDPPADASGAVGADARAAHATPFRQTVTRAQLSVEADPRGPLFTNVDVSLVRRRFGQDPHTLATDAGAADQLATLPGWSEGTQVLYVEAQLGLDTTTVASPYVSASAPSTGWRALAFGGPAWGVDGDRTNYLRYGVEARRYIDLYAGDRVLLLRGFVEGATAVGPGGYVPFTDLPRLGGPQQLRGYTRDRFRDRLVVLGTAEYRYPIWSDLSGFLFVDAGRVLAGADHLDNLVRSPDRLRVGGGGGLEMSQGNRFRLRGQVAGSPDGLFLQLSFEPAYRVTSSFYRI